MPRPIVTAMNRIERQKQFKLVNHGFELLIAMGSLTSILVL